MQQWEYVEVYASGRDIYVNQQKMASQQEGINIYEYLNQLGSQGWEMVGIGILLSGTPTYVFKRSKP